MRGFHIQHGWFLVIFALCTALVLANVVHYVLFRLLRRRETAEAGLGWGIQRYLRRPARAVFLLTCVATVLPLAPGISPVLLGRLQQGLVMLLVISLGWFAIGCVYVLQAVLLRRYDLRGENNVRARRVHTQFGLFRRMLIGFVVVVTVGALLWSFNDPRIWHYGSGLLASAGVASLVLAAAAKSTASNILAGLQIALTEPIKIDDVVVVQGEWGRIEEITTAYVVVRIWDLRRLIVPLSYFIENSFQNWTHESSDILGTAFVYVDYTAPVPQLRARLEEIVRESPLWDGAVCKLQVTNLSERTVELRCLMSSRNSGDNFDLRCHVREKMTEYLREAFPESLPRVRMSAMEGVAGPEDGAAGQV